MHTIAYPRSHMPESPRHKVEVYCNACQGMGTDANGKRCKACGGKGKKTVKKEAA